VTPGNRLTAQLFARIRPGIKSTARYDLRARNNASSRHLSLQSAAIFCRCGRSQTQITMIFPFHSGTSVWSSEFTINGSIHGLGARSLCEVLAGLNPGGPCSIPLTATRPRQNPRWQKPGVLSCSKGHSVLRRYYFGVELIFRNSASVPIQSGTQFYAGHNSVAKRRHIVPMAHSRGKKP
jgi:hypothetical protein